MANISLRGWGRVTGQKVVITATLSDAGLLSAVNAAKGAAVSVSGQSLTNYTVRDLSGNILVGPSTLTSQTVSVGLSQAVDNLQERLIAVTLSTNSIRVYGWAQVGNTLTPATPTDADAGSPAGLQARYYTNTLLVGEPIAEQVENVSISRNEALPAGVSGSNYSARWTGKIEAPVAGQYRFRMDHDAGARLTVNGQLLIDFWQSGAGRKTSTSGYITLPNSKVSIWAETFNKKTEYNCTLYWELPSAPGTFVVVPTSVLYVGNDKQIDPPPPEQSRNYVEVVNRYTE